METERGVHIHKPQHKKKASRFLMPGINLNEIRKHSPLLLSPRGLEAATAAVGCDGEGDSRSVKGQRWRNCLCSPTTHVGSFRCRFHRTSSMPRVGSVGSNLSDLMTKSRTPISSSTLPQ